MDEPQDKPIILTGGEILFGGAGGFPLDAKTCTDGPASIPALLGGDFTFAVRYSEDQVITGYRKDGHTYITTREATDEDRATLEANLEAAREFLGRPSGPQETP